VAALGSGVMLIVARGDERLGWFWRIAETESEHTYKQRNAGNLAGLECPGAAKWLEATVGKATCSQWEGMTYSARK
jgi:hypothetical protein